MLLLLRRRKFLFHKAFLLMEWEELLPWPWHDSHGSKWRMGEEKEEDWMALSDNLKFPHCKRVSCVAALVYQIWCTMMYGRWWLTSWWIRRLIRVWILPTSGAAKQKAWEEVSLWTPVRLIVAKQEGENIEVTSEMQMKQKWCRIIQSRGILPKTNEPMQMLQLDVSIIVQVGQWRRRKGHTSSRSVQVRVWITFKDDREYMIDIKIFEL